MSPKGRCVDLSNKEKSQIQKLVCSIHIFEIIKLMQYSKAHSLAAQRP